MLNQEDRRFLETLYQRYARVLFLHAYALLRDLPDALTLAEDTTQETFEKAMLKMETLRQHEAPEGWLKKTCRNTAMTKRRKVLNRYRITGTPLPIDEDHPVRDPQDFIEEWLLSNDLVKAREELIAALSEQEWAVFRSCYEGEQTAAQAAEALSISETAVRSTMQRIREKARKISPMFFAVLCFVFRF